MLLALKSKLDCSPAFVTFLHDYDVICIQGNRLDYVDKITIPGYKVHAFMTNRKQIARCMSGGVALLIKEEFKPYFHLPKNDSNRILRFEIPKQIFHTNENLICCVVYIPPRGLKYAPADPNLVDKVCSTSKHILFMGDFN